GNYIVRHDPLQYFTNINTEKANFVCFSQFATDLANKALPNLSWLSPNGCDDAHSCSIGTFDNWLQTEVGPLLASSYFQPGGDGLLIVAFEEDNKSGTPNCSTTTVGQGCGGQVETVLISQLSKLAYQSTAGDPANYNNTYDGANILRTIADALRVNTSGLGGASTRLPMADFFTVNAAVGPAVTPQPANQTVTVGQTATFSVVGAGTAPLSYQWQKNGTAISGATSASYTTPATTSADNGAQFVVVVSNVAGNVTSTAATLTVNAAAAAPTITTQPANQSVTVGQTATFTVVATGTAPLSYQWQKNGTAISGPTSASYTTPATTSADNGAMFIVVVSNVAGNVTSNAATLAVNAAGTMPQFAHVFLVVGENTSYSKTYNSSNMPYLTSLANQYGLSTMYWADTHPSIGNYEGMTAGKIFTNNDSDTPSSLPLSSD